MIERIGDIPLELYREGKQFNEFFTRVSDWRLAISSTKYFRKASFAASPDSAR